VLAAVLSGAARSRPPSVTVRSPDVARMLIGGSTTVVLLVFFALRPVRADVYARAAADALPDQPLAAVGYATESVRLDGSRALAWSRLAAANQAAARSTLDATTRRRLLEAGRAAAVHAVQLDPLNPYGIANLGSLLGDLERETPPMTRRADVEQAFMRARALDPNNTFVHIAAGVAALSAGDRERAASWAERSLRLYPTFGPPRALLAAVAASAGRESIGAGRSTEGRAFLERSVELYREALAADWHRDDAARAAAMRGRQQTMEELAALP